MCISFIKRSENKLLLAFNRDELYSRPATSLSFAQSRNAYAGIDKEAGGTWFAVDEKGSFAFVTNIREPQLIRPGRPTRGELPFMALRGDFGFMEKASDYNPFNLVWGSAGEINYYNNIERIKTSLSEDLISISNCVHPCAWPKVVEGKKLFEQIELDGQAELVFERSFDVLKRAEHSIFMRQDEYGTVASTVMLLREGQALMEERRWPSGEISRVSFQLKS